MSNVNALDLGIFLERKVKEETGVGGSGLSYDGFYGFSHFLKSFEREKIIEEFKERYPDWNFEPLGKTGVLYEKKNEVVYWAAQKKKDKETFELFGW